MAKRIKKYELAGLGCLIQGIGLLLLFVFPIGTVIGMALIILGSAKSVYFICGGCGNRITDKDVKICPVCKEAIEKCGMMPTTTPES